MRTLVWFRGKDLRLADHAPLASALANGEVVPCFVLDPYFFALERAQQIPHRMQFLLESLTELASNVARLGSRLVVVAGKSADAIPELARRVRADRVVGQRWSEPFARKRDQRMAAALTVPFELFDGETLHPPGTLRTQSGTPYGVFTPFARSFALEANVAEPLATPRALPPLPPDVDVSSVPLPTCEQLGIRRNVALLLGGEAAARARLAAFLAGPARDYDVARDRLDLPGSSRLSQDLKFGTLSPREVWHAVGRALEDVAPSALLSFRNELVWREFTHSTLWDHPRVLDQPYRERWRDFPWQNDEDAWDAWRRGTTGYPLIDAAARELLANGFVPNRARMITASFLTKHLLIDYRRGEAHYLQWLTDGDWAQNNAGWQWSAGCGMDAQPYFRVFNPVTQGEKFDPDGTYVKRWLPELARLPQKFVHAPFLAPKALLDAAGVQLGATYPEPIVPHALARTRFLAIAEEHLRAKSRG